MGVSGGESTDDYTVFIGKFDAGSEVGAVINPGANLDLLTFRHEKTRMDEVGVLFSTFDRLC
jgi:hypothetical protein